MNRTIIMPQEYVSRADFVMKRCRGKKVLHLGCSSSPYTMEEIELGKLLHIQLFQSTEELYGIDMDAKSLEIMKEQLGYNNLIVGDVEDRSSIELHEIFEILLAGDIIEHLSCPGRMLETVKTFMDLNSELIISTPNAFSVPKILRLMFGQATEGAEHVCVFSPPTLDNLLNRHGFEIVELYSGFDSKPQSFRRKLLFAFGTPFLKMFPVGGGL